MAERMVNSILVPVSPSGTGKTLMASMPGAFFSNQAVPEASISLNCRPSTQSDCFMFPAQVWRHLQAQYLASPLCAKGRNCSTDCDCSIIVGAFQYSGTSEPAPASGARHKTRRTGLAGRCELCAKTPAFGSNVRPTQRH